MAVDPMFLEPTEEDRGHIERAEDEKKKRKKKTRKRCRPRCCCCCIRPPETDAEDEDDEAAEEEDPSEDTLVIVGEHDEVYRQLQERKLKQQKKQEKIRQIEEIYTLTKAVQSRPDVKETLRKDAMEGNVAEKSKTKTKWKHRPTGKDLK